MTTTKAHKEAEALTLSQRLAILKALADPRRMEIMERLSSQEGFGACSDMRECLPIPRRRSPAP